LSNCAARVAALRGALYQSLIAQSCVGLCLLQPVVQNAQLHTVCGDGVLDAGTALQLLPETRASGCRLIAGPDGLHIRDGCVGLLCDIIAEEDAKWRKRRLKRLLARDARGP